MTCVTGRYRDRKKRERKERRIVETGEDRKGEAGGEIRVCEGWLARKSSINVTEKYEQ